MELIRKISQLLTKLRDRRAAVRYGEADVCAPCPMIVTEFPQQAWQDFLGYVDEAQNNRECTSRDCLQKLVRMQSESEKERIAFFAGLAENADEWRPILSFAEIPAQFDNDLFETITSEFDKAKSVVEQTEMIPKLFANADPTRLELLSLLLAGDIERHPQPSSPTAKELVEREKAVRNQLSELLSGDLTDEVRWWLIRAIACSEAPARSFLKSRLPGNQDERLACMALPVLLKAGFALLKSRSNHDNPKLDQVQQMYSGQLTRLTGVIGNSPI
ncbi:MAG: hypothetical protein CVV42_10460 [Candidatus Riflebacteria bacterium HGW-Riflebacteria-2]|nr:MAG: hypothetical protein CVV42_10460 [Candidatus Riflebacteria bacterium HGW-Riflebacteria-2]